MIDSLFFLRQKQTRHLKPSQVAGELGPKLGLVYFTNTSSQTRVSAQAQQQIFITLGSNKFMFKAQGTLDGLAVSNGPFWVVDCVAPAPSPVFFSKESQARAPVPHK
jgi:hypothetical protein